MQTVPMWTVRMCCGGGGGRGEEVVEDVDVRVCYAVWAGEFSACPV